MKDYRSFLKEDKKEKEESSGLFSLNKGQDRHVAQFSDFFGSIPGSLFCTNAKYAKFKQAVESSIDIYSTKDRITLDLFESKPSAEEDREIIQLGFRRYINADYRRYRAEYIQQLMRVFIFAVLGIALIFILHAHMFAITEWLSVCLEITATVLVWQLVGYLAFEHGGRKKHLDRLKQIAAKKYVFKTWE